ncbi:DNA-directed RNA polymerase sigma-70 factor [Parapedobacter pyrenivorans]|uniref:DNA-directed RNA polymerase sigma-70 factor n=1 Tax=Parapedobacter pyrenivorans TaxID=1305674 RepID=A0A917HST5_9SPHI|nr:sigma-70 family RNA polymerase sigma factor [Parapedobacter pyrenivorans]GGG88119.1 DNA-directed RNA polymerase sigma-70 factor [Parapedobacter pyrenivorans]
MKTSSKSIGYWESEFRKGNPAAFRHVFDLHYRPLCYYAGTILDDLGEVEDAVSEVFVKLWRRAADFDNLSSIKGFLYISTKNLCLDRLKQYKRREASLGDYRHTLETLVDGEDYSLLETEVLQLVYEEIERLPTKARAIFKLIFFDGKKTDEVAAQLGVSVKTVRNQKARAIQLLQTALLKKGLPAFIWIFCCVLPK